MYNDNTELLKLVGLNQYDIDRDKTTIYVDISSNDITINLYLKRGICSCPYCNLVMLMFMLERLKIFIILLYQVKKLISYSSN